MDEEAKSMSKREWVAMVLSFTASLAYIILLSLFVTETIFVPYPLLNSTVFWYISAVAMIAESVFAFWRNSNGGVFLVTSCIIGLVVLVLFSLYALVGGQIVGVLQYVYPHLCIYIACLIAGIYYIKVGGWKLELAVIKSREANNEHSTDQEDL